jgi:hypothetical protein
MKVFQEKGIYVLVPLFFYYETVRVSYYEMLHAQLIAQPDRALAWD